MVNAHTLRHVDRFLKGVRMGRAVVIEIQESESTAEVLGKLARAGIINLVEDSGASFVARSNVNTTTLRKFASRSRVGKSEQ